MGKRYISLDNAKGFAILMMLLLHAIMQQIAEGNGALFIPTMNSLQWYYIILLVPLAVLGLMGTFFTFATCLTATIQMLSLREKNPEELPKFLLNRIIFGFLLIVLSKIARILFGTPFFEEGKFYLPDISLSYEANTLDSIAWAGAIVPLVLYIFLKPRKNKEKKEFSSFKLIPYFIGLTIIWFAISPLMKSLINSVLPWLSDNNLGFLYYILSKFGTGRFEFFPVIGFGFLGVIFGIFLREQISFKKLMYFVLSWGLVCISAFGLWILIDSSFIENFASEEVPLPLQILNLGLEPLVFSIFLGTGDFSNEEKRLKRAKRSVWLRRFSIVSLTAFSIGTNLANGFFKWFELIWGDSVDHSGEIPMLAWNAFQIASFVLVIFIFWEILVRIWQKIDYKFSLEWFLLYFGNKITRRRRESKIDVNKVLYNFDQIENLKKN